MCLEPRSRSVNLLRDLMNTDIIEHWEIKSIRIIKIFCIQKAFTFIAMKLKSKILL